MARITPSSLVGSIRGKIGSVIYSSWKGLQYAKLMPVSIHNPMTAAQGQVRSILVELLSMWQSLNVSQKAQWEEYAQGLGTQSLDNSQIGSLGLIKPVGNVMSGSNAFLGVNARLRQLGSSAVVIPPADAIAGPTYFGFGFFENLMTAIVSFPANSLEVDDYIRLFIRSDQPGGHTYLAAWRRITAGDIDGVTGVVSYTFEIDTLRMGSGGLLADVGLENILNCPVSAQVDGLSKSGYKSPSSGVQKAVVNPAVPDILLLPFRFRTGAETFIESIGPTADESLIDAIDDIWDEITTEFKNDLTAYAATIWAFPLPNAGRLLFEHALAQFSLTDETLNMLATSKLDLEAAGIPTTVAGLVDGEYMIDAGDPTGLSNEW